MKKLNETELKTNISQLTCGEEISFSGIIYTARDQAHKRIVELINKNKKLPIDLKNQIIYYCGPTKTPKGKIIGSCGPTTSSRMDEFVEPLLKAGMLAMIGKGRRSKQVRNLIKKYKAVYFIAPSGCGALLANKIISNHLVGFNDLGPEAIYKLEVKYFPLIVAIDSKGRSIYPDIKNNA